VVVGDIKPLLLPILIGVKQLVRQVLFRGVLAHLDAGPSDYSGVVGARLGLHAEEVPEEYPVGLDPKKASQKWTKTQVWKIPLGLRLRYSIP
jgi:hypothetical protein